MFFAVVAVILMIGTLLVYALLLTNAEERSFEVALMRSQGMRKAQLLYLMLFQSALFIIQGSSLLWR